MEMRLDVIERKKRKRGNEQSGVEQLELMD
jgi:hypothetical protein